MKPVASIARRSVQTPDPLGFDALRLQALTAAQAASGELWTDYNLHDPGVTLLEALCFALTEDLFAARHPVPTLLGLDPGASPADWARFGLHQPADLLPCHPCTERDWQRWLQQQLPQAQQLQMQALRDTQGHPTGLWRLRLQSQSEAPSEQLGLRARALRAYSPMRNLGEDLASAPELLRPRWVELELSLLLEGERDVCELLAELLQRCDEGISARPPEGPPTRSRTQPEDEGPPGLAGGADDAGERVDKVVGKEVGKAHGEAAGDAAFDAAGDATGDAAARTAGGPADDAAPDPDFLFVSDLARRLHGVRGLAAIDRLQLRLAPDEAAEPQDSAPTPPGAVRRSGPGWALRLRWPDHPAQLQAWQLARPAGPVQLPVQALLQMLADRRRVHLHSRSQQPHADQALAAALAPTQPRPPLPGPREDHYPASAALPPLYRQALRAQARLQPGLHAQWQGYLSLLEQGLNQVQVQREQLPQLYDLHTTEADATRSYWSSPPNDSQLPGVEALYRQPRAQLAQAAWVDEDGLSRRHRVLDMQLALHGEALDHASLQALPCYFTPAAWPAHLLRLKRQWARRLLRLGRLRGTGADLSQALIGQPDNTPALQERLGLMLGLAQTHSRLLSRSWQAQGLPVPDEQQAPDNTPVPPDLTRRPVLNPASRRRAPDWPRLRRDLPALRQRLPAPLLRAAVRPELFQWAPDPAASRGTLWLGPDDAAGRHWPLAAALDEAQASELARALHEAACHLQAAAEGMHLVEHLLLRPLAAPPRSVPSSAPPSDPTPAHMGAQLAAPTGANAASDTGSSTAPHRITLVFSGWTARGADPRFRRLAAQLLAREAPAHLYGELLWLEAAEMQAFETDWQAWLAARRAYAEALLTGHDEAATVVQVDALSARLRTRLAALRAPGTATDARRPAGRGAAA